LAAHFAKRNTKKYGGANKRAGKNSFPLNPFLFARPASPAGRPNFGGYRGLCPLYLKSPKNYF